MPTRIRILLLALVAFAAVAAPAASASDRAPVRTTLPLELEIFDLHATTVCGGTWVFANVEGEWERRVYFKADGEIDYQVEAFHGRITWFTRDTGKSYTSALVNKTRIDFPEGVDLFKPVRVTVSGLHGGSFPIGGGPAGSGTLVYDGFMYATGDEGVYWATDGGPVSMSGNFETTNRRICAALA
jgi:hypothetical protein